MISLLVSAALAGVSTGERSDLDAVYAPRRVAVLIGVDAYGDPALQGLQFPAKDAADLGAVLQNVALGGFDDVRIVSGAQQTTAAAIEQAISAATADLQPDDTFLLYASGHGTLTVDPTGSALYLLPSDGVLDRPEQTGIPVAWLEETVNALPARRRVLILDTCHNGRVGSRSALNTTTAQSLATMRGEAPAPSHGLSVSESEARLFAAEYHQAAYEDPTLENGVYTHFLIEALTHERGAADLDGDGLIDVVEAHDFAMDKTFTHTGGAQMPRAEYRITGREKIYLSGDPSSRTSAEQALLSAYDRILSSTQLFVDGVSRGAAVGAHPIEPGRHQIVLQNSAGKTVLQQRVHLQAGTTVPLEDFLTQSQRRWVFSAGSVLRHGPASDYFHPVLGEVQLSLLRPVVGPSWLHHEVHGRLASMVGLVGEDAITQVFGGEIALGGSVGVQWGAVAMGPQVEMALPWRVYEDGTGGHIQGALTPMPGGRVLWAISSDARTVVLRYDARWSPYSYDGQQTHLWHHGIAVGLQVP